MSLIVIKPSNLPSLTNGNFSILCCCNSSSASSKVVPTGAVIKFSLVITSEILIEKSSIKRKSRFVKIPTNVLSSSLLTIGTPEIRYLPINASASYTLSSGVKKNGFEITPFSERLTF